MDGSQTAKQRHTPCFCGGKKNRLHTTLGSDKGWGLWIHTTHSVCIVYRKTIKSSSIQSNCSFFAWSVFAGTSRLHARRNTSQLFVTAHHQTVAHVCTIGKYGAYIWPKPHISSDFLGIMCVYKHYMWCDCDTIFRILRLKSMQNRGFGCKPPHAFHGFQTPSCFSTELHASSSNRVHKLL